MFLDAIQRVVPWIGNRTCFFTIQILGFACFQEVNTCLSFSKFSPLFGKESYLCFRCTRAGYHDKKFKLPRQSRHRGFTGFTVDARRRD